jgi:hypothetical protein
MNPQHEHQQRRLALRSVAASADAAEVRPRVLTARTERANVVCRNVLAAIATERAGIALNDRLEQP